MVCRFDIMSLDFPTAYYIGGMLCATVSCHGKKGTLLIHTGYFYLSQNITKTLPLSFISEEALGYANNFLIQRSTSYRFYYRVL